MTELSLHELKKVYTKPRVTIVKLTAEEAILGGCKFSSVHDDCAAVGVLVCVPNHTAGS